MWVPLARFTTDQDTGLSKLPENRVPNVFETMVKVPPAAKVPDVWRLPDASAPVENDSVPRLMPVCSPFIPLMAIRVEPLKVNPPVPPLRVPPEFVKSTELSANAANGSARLASNTTHKSRFIKGLFLLNIVESSYPVFSEVPQYVDVPELYEAL